MDGSEATSPAAGGCQCGGVRYELTERPSAVYVCHCRECRRQSASAFGISVIVSWPAVRLTSGAPRSWSRPTATGDTLDCAFCGTCGSRLWHRSVRDGSVSVKGGSLDEPPDLRHAMHIWTSRMLPGISPPEGVTCYPEEPPIPPSPAATGS